MGERALREIARRLNRKLRARLRAGMAFVAAGVLVFGAPGTTSAGNDFAFLRQQTFLPVPVVVVIFDELPLASLLDRSGGIDDHLFPNFARLQATSTWFRNTTTVSAFTEDALPALLSGRYPSDQLLSTFEPRTQNLFTLLGDVYDIRTLDRFPELCPSRACGVQRAPAPTVSRDGFGYLPHGDRGAKFFSFLDLLEDEARRPTLYLLHIVLPHSPWRYLPSGQLYPEDDPEPGEVNPAGPGRGWGQDAWLATQAYQRHLLQVRATDRLLGELLDRMEGVGILDDALLAVLADHGVAFEPGFPKRVVEHETVGEIAAVPFFLKRPSQWLPMISDVPLETVDVLPTIADALQLSHLWAGIEGLSAVRDAIDPMRQRRMGSVAFDPMGAEKWLVAAEKYDIFGHEGDSVDLFDLGPRDSEQLIGASVANLSPGTSSDEEIEPSAVVDSLDTFRGADPRDEVFPALLEGRLTPPEDGSRIVAVAVNGRVAAVTRTYLRDDQERFYAMMSPDWFDTHDNELSLFLVLDVRNRVVVPLTLPTT